jgi:hypothetical protein
MAAIFPATSCPRTRCLGFPSPETRRIAYGVPVITCQSPMNALAAMTRIRTSPRPATGVSTSSNRRTSEPYSSWTTTFMLFGLSLLPPLANSQRGCRLNNPASGMRTVLPSRAQLEGLDVGSSSFDRAYPGSCLGRSERHHPDSPSDGLPGPPLLGGGGRTVGLGSSCERHRLTTFLVALGSYVLLWLRVRQGSGSHP